MVDDYTLAKVLDKIKRISVEKLDNTRILLNTDDKLPDDITLKNAVILMTCVIKDGDKFYQHLFLEEVLQDKQTQCKSYKKVLRKEVISIVRHSTKWWDWVLVRR